MSTWFARQRASGWTCAAPSTAAAEFHRGLAGYAATPLVELPELAAQLDVGRLLVKDESARLGLPAFKALGASWAVQRVVAEQPGRTLTIVTATDGNHGRAVARFARLLGHRASIYLPRGVGATAIDAIAGEGAEITRIDGSYEQAVAAAAEAAGGPDTVLVQDTAWDGYERIPGWIIEGYETLFGELDDQLPGQPDLVIVPVGVGSLLQSALAHYRSESALAGTAVVAVEPEVAAAIPASLAAGHPITVATGTTVMAGLNCGTPSASAWPYIVHGVDGVITISDAEAITAAHRLAERGIAAGPCGAASLAAADAILSGAGADERREQLHIDAESTVILLVTEGASANPVPPLPQ